MSYDPKPTPVYDLRDLRSRLAGLLGEVDRIIQHLESPPDVPDLTDSHARLTYGGHRYRVVGGTFGAARPTLHLELDEVAEETGP